MEVVDNNKKPSYEELEGMLHQVTEEYNKIASRLQQAEMYIRSINRLDYLFRVMNNPKEYSPEFISYVTKDIEEALTIKNNETESE